MEELKLRDEFIKLGQAMKAAGIVSSGIDAKMLIQDGQVTVNGEVEINRDNMQIVIKSYRLS